MGNCIIELKYNSLKESTLPATTYNYTGNVQSYTVPAAGVYELKVWGGRGGDCSSNWGESASGGQGGITTTYALLDKDDILYIYVGGNGSTSSGAGSGNVSGGWNGGAHGGYSYDWDAHDYNNTGGGGGATHIAKNSNRGILSNYASYQDEVIAVAGGGGGAVYRGADSGPTGAYGGGAGGGTGGGGSGQFGNGAPTGGYGGYPGGGGGGWEGGRSGNWVGGSERFRTAYGGTGHYKDASITMYGTTYTSSTQNGGSSSGKATITQMALIKNLNRALIAGE